MLDERIIEKLVERLANRIEKGNTYLLKEIAKCIEQIGSLTPSKAQQLAQILKYGGNYQLIAKELARYTHLNIQDIYAIFESVAKENQVFAKQFYDYRGIKYIPYEQNIALQNQVKAIAKMTADQYVNMSNTLAFATTNEQGKIQYTSLSETYQKTIDEAVLSVAQGKDTFEQQMRKTIKQLGNSGIRTVDYDSGYSQRLDSAVRMNMQGALRDLSNTLQKQFGKQYGADGIEISVHEHPAPDHAPIQGHQFKMDEYYKMQSRDPFKDVNGKDYTAIKRHIGEWNCYHYEFAIIVGVSQPNYTEEQLQEILNRNEEGFEFEGRHYTLYQGTQLQRRIETNIRKQKDIQIMARTTNDDLGVYESQEKISQLSDTYNKLSKTSGLPTKIERLKVDRYRTYSTKAIEKQVEMKYNTGNKLTNIKLYREANEIQNQIRNNKYNLNIISDKQEQHNISSILKYKKGKSYFNLSLEEEQKLVNKYAGTGYIPNTAKGNLKKIEICTTDRIIGKYINKNYDIEMDTNSFVIHYSKNGVHIVPASFKED